MNDLKQNRILALDAMRGVAIFGIFLVNMLSFHSPMLYLDPFSWWEGNLDQGVYIIIDVLAQGSFYPMFALLFGYGLNILRERTLSKGLSFTGVAARRFLFLLIIGFVHAFLIWHGDILINYALIGFLYLLFLNWSGKKMIVIGSLFAVIPNLLFSLLLIVTVYFAHSDEISIYSSIEAEKSVEIYQQGSFSEITVQRLTDWYNVNNPLNGIFLLISILPLFLIGGGAAKLRWVERIKELKKPFSIAFVVFLVLGLWIKLSPYLFDGNLALEYVQDIIGGPLLAIAYALGIALLADWTKGKRILSIFAPVGRMSMSNYLAQSFFSTLLFYSYGFGLYGKISVFFGTIIVILFYVLQIFLSNHWLKNHVYGPFEWLWRNVTYKKKQPWLRRPKFKR